MSAALKKLCEEEGWNAEEYLLHGILESGALDNDIEFFEGDTFKHICKLLGLDSEELGAESIANIKKRMQSS